MRHQGDRPEWDIFGTDLHGYGAHPRSMDNGYDPALQEDVLLLLNAVIAALEIVADELRAREVSQPASWTAHRLRPMNQGHGDFDLAVKRALDGVARSLI